MKTYKVKVTETYVFEVDIEADNMKVALDKVRDGYYNHSKEFDGVFCTDANSFENVKFSIVK